MIEYHPHPTDPTLVVLKVTKHYIAKHSDEDLQAAVLAEREACAKLCESMGVYPELNVWNGGPDWYKRQKECAAAIRQRGDK
jgi:hypothetical protein